MNLPPQYQYHKASSGESAMQGGNGAEDPLRTVVVNFKGAVQCLGD